MKLIILFISFFIGVGFCFNAELDSVEFSVHSVNPPLFKHKKEKKWTKERARKRSRKPSTASVYRLNRISRQAKNTMSRIDNGHQARKAEIKGNQRVQRKYSRRKDHYKVKKSSNRGGTRPIRKVRGLEKVKSNH